MSETAIVRSIDGLKQITNSASLQESIKAVLPKHLTPDRVAKMALVAANRTPRLLECTTASVCKALMTASELGLDCSGTLGSGYLVPYRNSKINAYECQFIPGYRGLIDLARRSGQILRIEAHVVYAQDEFVCEHGLEPKLVHKPYLKADRRHEIVCVYAIGELKDGSKQMEVMTLAEVDAIRKRSKAGNDGPWVTDYAEMARKTVVKRLCKYLPLSAELEKAILIDNEIEDRFIDAPATEPASDQPPPASRAAALAGKLKGKSQRKGESSSAPPAPAAPAEAPVEEDQPPIEVPGEVLVENDPSVPAAMTRHEMLVISLSEACNCDLPAARARLEKCAKPFDQPFDQLEDKHLDRIEDQIRKGAIVVGE